MSIEAMKRLVAAVEAIPEDVEGWMPDALTDALIDAKKAIAEAEKQEPVGYAGVKVWVGNQQVCRVLTQIELHHAVSPWRTVEMAAMACISKLKEKNT
jgi:predicted transcriptional regulator